MMNKKCISIDSVKRKTERHSFKTRLDGRPDPRLGFWVLTASPGRLGHFFKLKIRRFSKKNNQKSTGLQPGLAGLTGSHRVFPSFIFFLTRSSSSFKLVGFQINLLDLIEFQNYAERSCVDARNLKIICLDCNRQIMDESQRDEPCLLGRKIVMNDC